MIIRVLKREVQQKIEMSYHHKKGDEPKTNDLKYNIQRFVYFRIKPMPSDQYVPAIDI